ncbi:MAG: radical SAM/SPASM domain-containing protein [Candidatus Sumerlaeia bacterium]
MNGWEYLSPAEKHQLVDAIFARNSNVPGPFHMEMDPTDKCNARCRFCNNQNTRADNTLSWEVIRKLWEDGIERGLKSVRLSGGGEPLVHPDILPMLSWLKDSPLILDNLTTNGIALDGKRMEAVLDAKPRFLMSSLNFPGSDEYRTEMGLPESAFERVLQNLENYSKGLWEKGVREECQLIIQFFITPANVNQPDAFFDVLDRIQPTAVRFGLISGTGAATNLSPEALDQFCRNIEFRAMEARDRYFMMFILGPPGNALTQKLYAVEPADTPEPSLDAYRFCLMPWYSLAVRGSGNVYPCCMLISDERVQPLGNVKEQSLREIWEGKAFERYRNEIRRVMILGHAAAMSGKRCRHTTGLCWNPNACDVASLIGDSESYTRLREAILLARQSPRAHLAKGINRLLQIPAACFKR